MVRSQRRANRVAAVLCVGVMALALGGCDKVMSMVRTSPSERAVHRVEFILQTLASGVGGTSLDMQTAICRWEADEALLDRDVVGVAMDAFDQWRRAGGFYQGVESFEVDPEFEPADPGDPADTVYLYVTVNGQGRWLRVPPKGRISWVDGEGG